MEGPEVVPLADYQSLKQELADQSRDFNEKFKKTIEERDIKWKKKIDELLTQIKTDYEQRLTNLEQTKVDIETKLTNVLTENTRITNENSRIKTQLRLYEDAQNFDSAVKTPMNDLTDDDQNMDTTKPEVAKADHGNSGWVSAKKRRYRNKTDIAMNKKQILDEDFPNLPKTNNPILKDKLVRQVSTVTPSSSSLPLSTLPDVRDSDSRGPEDAIKQGGCSLPGPFNSALEQPEKTRRIRVPPIIIRDKTKFTDISRELYQKKIDYGKAMTVSEGVKVHPLTFENYKKIVEILEKSNTPFHSFRLQEEKELHVVIRGVLETWSVEKVQADLESLGFTPTRVIRWNFKSGDPMPLVLCILPKSQSHIFDMTKLDTISVRVESHRTKTKETQCHRCQLYGHSQYKCRAPPKCLKCAGAHMSFQCQAGPNLRPKCANCDGDHPANYRECPKHPLNLKIAREQAAIANNPAPANNFTWGKQDNAKLRTVPNTTVVANTNPIDIMSSISDMIQQSMQAFLQEIGKSLQMQLGTIAQNMLPSLTNTK